MADCAECGGPILPDRRTDAKYCSHTCGDTAEKRRARERRGTGTGKRRGPYKVPRKMYQSRLVRERERATRNYRTAMYGDPSIMPTDKYAHARRLGYRSGLEVKVARELENAGVDFEYETRKVFYTVPSRVAQYTPDVILPNGIVIETKGRFITADRQKHILIKKEHPGLDIRFVFSNPKTRISKQSPTTYAMWCSKHDFLFAARSIPKEWIDEPRSEARVEALTNAGLK